MLQIPKPCNEKWDNMEPNDKGRYCFSCQKTVHDFSGWDTKDIENFLKENKVTCARIETDKLADAMPKKQWWFLSRVAAGLAMALALFPAFGQQKKKPKQQKPVVRQDDPILLGEIVYVPDSLQNKDTVHFKPPIQKKEGKVHIK